MLAAPIPENDAQRLETLRGLEILDTESEERFDRITRLATRVLNVPIALVSLVDSNRQWFKSCVGLGATETPRDVSFCGHAIQSDDLFYIPDAREDVRFADNPLVTGEPFVIFYAGQPLKAVNGYNMGTLCIIDHQPRQLSDAEKLIIQDMARIAENEMNIMKLNEALKIQKESERQVRDVLDNVREGLFSVLPDLTIGPAYSPSLVPLLNETKPVGKSFVAIIAEIAEVDQDALKTYLGLLLGRKILRGAEELNVLGKIQLRDGRTLSFRFNPAIREDRVTHLVVTVNDITAQVRLAAEIEEAETKSRAMIEKLMDVMHLSPQELQEFLASAAQELEAALQVLVGAPNGDAPSADQIAAVRRHVHTAKGDAGVLGVQVFVRRAHELEEFLERGESTPPATVREKIKNLAELLEEIGATVEKAGQLGAALPGGADSRLNAGRIQEQARRLAQEHNCDVELDLSAFHPDLLPARLRPIARNAIVQFLRNSIAHGIEPTAQRISAGKAATGKLKIATEQSGPELKLIYEDDGRGLQINKLRDRIITDGRWPADQVSAWSQAEVARHIFEPGVSTSDSIDTMSGRGVGMDIVRESVRGTGGTLKLHSRSGAFFRVELTWGVA